MAGRLGRMRDWLFARRPIPEPATVARRARSDEPLSAADLIAQYERPAPPPEAPDRTFHWQHALRSFVILVVLVAAAAFLLRQYVAQTYYIPSESMEPTLHGCATCHDDRVLVEKLSYHFHGPRPGDIVVFDNPGHGWADVGDRVLIKRVIGVAGDTIVIRGGHVYRDGRQLDEPYVNPSCHGTQPGPRYRPGGYHVGPGELFVMGDNRCDSDDSRYNGPVPVSSVVGRAVMIIWPLGRITSL